MLDLLRTLFLLLISAPSFSWASPITDSSTEHGIHVVQSPSVSSSAAEAQSTEPAIINIASGNITTLSSIGDKHIDVTCFAPMEKVDLPPASPVDCYRAAQEITLGGKSGAGIDWSTEPGRGRPVPDFWSHGTCRIEIVPAKEGNVEDNFSTEYLAQVAGQIIIPCIVRDRYKLGGLAIVGDNKVFQLITRGWQKAAKE